MTETMLYAHAPCGWRTWVAEGEPVPEHDCPKSGGDAYPVVSMSGPEAITPMGRLVARLADDVSFLAQYIQLSEEGHATIAEIGALGEIAERTERGNLPRSLGIDMVTGRRR